MEESKSAENPGFLEYVYQLNRGLRVKEALEFSLREINDIDVSQWNKLGYRTYEEGKWTIHEILQHLIDWERIWCYRALLFARKEGTIPVAMDQELMAMNSNADDRTIEELLDELLMVRQSSIMLFNSFDQEMLEMECVFFEYKMPLSAFGLTITAHQKHHFHVIQNRYIPLLE